MKKILFVSLLSLSTLTFINSCVEEEVPEEVVPGLEDHGTITVSGTTYKLNKGAVIGYKASDNSKPNLYTLQFSQINNNIHRTAKLTVNFPFGQTIDGNYDVDDTSRVLNAGLSSFTFTDGNYVDGHYNLVEGTCTVSRVSENQFNVSFNIMPEDSIVVSGNYNGPVEIHESFY